MSDEEILREYKIECAILSEIDQLSATLKEKKNKLILMRLKRLADFAIDDENIPNITDIKFVFTKSKWRVTYTHETHFFREDLYNHEDDEEEDDTEQYRITKVKFGYDGERFYVTNNKYSRIECQIKPSGRLLIFNNDYTFELDQGQQSELITTYSNITDLPEYFALRILNFISYQKWTNENIAEHFNI